MAAGAAHAGEAGQPGAPPATASAATPDPAKQAQQASVDPDATAALAARAGISATEAAKRLAAQQALGDLGARTEKSLAGRSGGHYLDASGRLVITTLDAAGDEAARRAGARPHRVDDTSARLAGIMREFDRHAARSGAGAAQGWHVDVLSNSVVLTLTSGAEDPQTLALRKVASAFGASVRVSEQASAQAPRTTAYLVGGFEYVTATGGACSVGFNTQDSVGRNVVLTAGHCVKTSTTMSRNGYRIGGTRTANYPTDDYGTFWNDYSSYWQPSVSVYKYNGTYVNVRGQWNAPPVGATVCKSGRTTGWTCGTITAHNQTVVYGGHTVYGLVRHNACVEPGDSGGSNISAGAYALGVTSGASLTSAGACLSKVGSPNVSWYQPIGEALSANGLRLLYQPPPVTNVLAPGQTLGSGERLVSPDGQFVLVMQQDGNLVEIAPGNRPIWSSGTQSNPGTQLINQADGNMVLVAPGNRPIWATGTHGNSETVLVLQSDANLVAYAPGNRAIWANYARP